MKILQELKSVIRAIPEIEELVGSEEANQVFCISEHDEEKVKSAVRTIFTLLMSAGPDTTKQIVSKLKHRLHMESQVFFFLLLIPSLTNYLVKYNWLNPSRGIYCRNAI